MIYLRGTPFYGGPYYFSRALREVGLLLSIAYLWERLVNYCKDVALEVCCRKLYCKAMKKIAALDFLNSQNILLVKYSYSVLRDLDILRFMESGCLRAYNPMFTIFLSAGQLALCDKFEILNMQYVFEMCLLVSGQNRADDVMSFGYYSISLMVLNM